jgi:hypothetical protein
MTPAPTLTRFALTFAIAAIVACGGEKGITDPPGGGIDTAAVNAAARIASTNLLLGQIEDAVNALNQSLVAGGAPSASPELAGSPALGATRSLGASLGTAPPPDAAKCTFDDVNVRHVCPAFTQANGIVIRSWFQFLDAANKPQKDPDTATTVAIRRFVSKTGFMTTQFTPQGGPTVPAVDTMNNSDTLTLTGLKGPPEGRKLNGKGTMSVVIVPQGQPVGHMSATTTTENFAFIPPPPPPATPTVRYPISGKVTAVVTSYREDKPTQGSTTTQVTTYDGSKIAKLVITAATGQLLRTCTWDMTLQNVLPTCTVP